MILAGNTPFPTLARKLISLALVLWAVFSTYMISVERPTSMVIGTDFSGDYDTQPLGRRIRVGTFNIHGGEDINDQDNLDRVYQSLNQSRLNLIGLNEVRSGLFEENNQANDIASRLDTGWVYAPTREKNLMKNFGNAILSNAAINDYVISPLLNERVVNGEHITGNSHRNMIMTSLDMDGQTVTAIVTHIDRGALHQEQLQQVLDTFALYYPAILLGDLNSEPDNELIRQGLESHAFEDSLASYNTDYPHRLDWILTRGLKTIHSGVNKSDASDHPHYWVELELED